MQTLAVHTRIEKSRRSCVPFYEEVMRKYLCSMNTQGQTTHTEKSKIFPDRRWGVSPRVPEFSSCLQVVESTSTFAQMWMKLKCFLLTFPSMNLEFRNQFPSILNIFTQSKLNRFLIICGSETQIRQYLIFFLLLQFNSSNIYQQLVLSPIHTLCWVLELQR